MHKSWMGPAVVGLIVAGISTFLFLNIETRGTSSHRDQVASDSNETPKTGEATPPGTGAPIREYPIGDEVEQNHIRIAAVWLPAVTMANMPSDPNTHLIHIEADVKALEGNPNGFAKDEKVDYLKVSYTLVPAEGGSPIVTGELIPMMARDGFHYGANIGMPKPGRYRLVYDISPPTMGRHSDPATGVAPWWEPFQARFDWTVEPEATQVTVR